MGRRKRFRTGNRFFDWVLEWIDAILFAVVVVTLINTFWFQAFKIPSSSMENSLYTGDHLFVSKLTYGPRMPQTPLTIPFTHNVFFGKESYSTSVQWKYRRLPGFREVRRGDCVVFGFPDGDTVLRKSPVEDYHTLVRMFGRDAVKSMGDVIVRPMDKKDHYVKRCVAVAGDTLEVKDGLVWVNGERQEVYPGIQLTYRVTTKASSYPASLDAEQLAKVKSSHNVIDVEPMLETGADDTWLEIFPFVRDFGWTRDYFGPVWIPKQGETVTLTEDNLPLYERIISVYEAGDVSKALEEGKYTFKQNYYFMMGDNRGNSQDSRFWGFLPKERLIGQAVVMFWPVTRIKKLNHNYNIDALDISPKALKVAKNNAEYNQVEINFFESDIFSNVNKKYTCIISNPPYIRYDEEIMDIVKNNEPHIALYAEDNGLYFYKKIISEASNHLEDEFIIAFEIGEEQGQDIIKLAKKYFPDSKVILEQDLQHLDRFVFIIKHNVD